MSKKIIRIGFIGAGSIGSLFGGYLASIKSETYSIDVILFCRRAHSDAINKNGLKIQIGQETKEIKNIKAYKSSDKFEELLVKSSKKPFDFLFLTTKTYDIRLALDQYKKLIDECKRLVVLQNGVGNEDIVKEYINPKKIIRAVTVNGVVFEKSGFVIHTGMGLTKVGFPFKNENPLNYDELEEIGKDLNVLSELLNISGLETIVVDDIIKECWEKVFVNIGINSFGALTRLENGKLLESEGLKRLMAEAVNEAIMVAEAKRINLSKKDFISATYEVAEKTAKNKNSMLQDILKGKKTEIDFINGRIVKYAKELNLNVPINELLTYLVKGLEPS